MLWKIQTIENIKKIICQSTKRTQASEAAQSRAFVHVNIKFHELWKLSRRSRYWTRIITGLKWRWSGYELIAQDQPTVATLTNASTQLAAQHQSLHALLRHWHSESDRRVPQAGIESAVALQVRLPVSEVRSTKLPSDATCQTNFAPLNLCRSNSSGSSVNSPSALGGNSNNMANPYAMGPLYHSPGVQSYCTPSDNLSLAGHYTDMRNSASWYGSTANDPRFASKYSIWLTKASRWWHQPMACGELSCIFFCGETKRRERCLQQARCGCDKSFNVDGEKVFVKFAPWTGIELWSDFLFSELKWRQVKRPRKVARKSIRKMFFIEILFNLWFLFDFKSVCIFLSPKPDGLFYFMCLQIGGRAGKAFKSMNLNETQITFFLWNPQHNGNRM